MMRQVTKSSPKNGSSHTIARVYPSKVHEITNAQAAPADNASVATPVDTTAHVTATVPADAEIWIDGTKTTSTGAVRQFQSPPLTTGQQYSYEVRAGWSEHGHEVIQTQNVAVTAGAHVTVSFPVSPKTAGQASAVKKD